MILILKGTSNPYFQPSRATACRSVLCPQWLVLGVHPCLAALSRHLDRGSLPSRHLSLHFLGTSYYS